MLKKLLRLLLDTETITIIPSTKKQIELTNPIERIAIISAKNPTKIVSPMINIASMMLNTLPKRPIIITGT